MPELSERVQGRLLNWKFAQALGAVRDEIEHETRASKTLPDENQLAVIEALATTFGDPGWFEGSMAEIVRAAVWFLGVED